MKELIKYFVHSLERKKHIFELINHIKLVLTIGNDRDNCSIVFDKGSVFIDSSNVELDDTLKVKIHGNTDAISSLLDGSLKLREGVLRDQLDVVGSFRNKLLLESVFYLAGKSKI